MSTASTTRGPAAGPWFLILCLVGLDYFSTLAYLPSLAVQAAGPLAPLAAAMVVAVTLLLALPVYCYVVGRSPDGRGAMGLLERMVRGWRGKLLVLLLLSFVATDYVVTQNLSIADAAEHLRANPFVRTTVEPFLQRNVRPQEWIDATWWAAITSRINAQLIVTLGLTLITFASWAYWRKGSTARFLNVAGLVVGVYLLLTAVVISSGLAYLLRPECDLASQWWQTVQRHAGPATAPSSIMLPVWLAILGFAVVPYAALGLSGFELSMAVAPLVQGDPNDANPPRGRIRNMRKLLFAAAALMAVCLLGAVFVSAVLIPSSAFTPGGSAVHRSLAYLAHGGVLADGHPASAANPLFGPAFGTLYDAATITILCLAGACVLIALRDYVPEYLQRFGMELELARRLGVKMQFFNLIVLAVTFLFRAEIARLQWAYVTSVLMLLSGASLAAAISVRRDASPSLGRHVMTGVSILALLVFAAMALQAARISLSGLEIALAFSGGILVTSILSRWLRSTELRLDGFDFADDASRQRFADCCAHQFQVLVPHRPGLRSRTEKEQAIRARHRLAPDVPIILIEAELGDPSEFLHRPLLRVTREDGMELIRATRCASIAHVLAAIALEMSRSGHPPELHFGWSDESPLAANLNFLLFGEGNIPWMVRELLRRRVANPDQRPAVILG